MDKLRRLVSAFENSKVWKTLPLSSEDGIQINIGNETPLGKMNDVSVISASFKTGETSKGSISVIGPTRMPYEKVVALVEYISENIEKGCCTAESTSPSALTRCHLPYRGEALAFRKA